MVDSKNLIFKFLDLQLSNFKWRLGYMNSFYGRQGVFHSTFLHLVWISLCQRVLSHETFALRYALSQRKQKERFGWFAIPETSTCSRTGKDLSVKRVLYVWYCLTVVDTTQTECWTTCMRYFAEERIYSILYYISNTCFRSMSNTIFQSAWLTFKIGWNEWLCLLA